MLPPEHRVGAAYTLCDNMMSRLRLVPPNSGLPPDPAVWPRQSRKPCLRELIPVHFFSQVCQDMPS